MRTLQDKYIVMTTDELTQVLVKAKEYKHFFVFDSDQNRDGQGEWHCDVEFSDEPLDRDSWGDGEENFSFDEAPVSDPMTQYIADQAMLSAKNADIDEWGVLDEMDKAYKDFCKNAEEFIAKAKEKQNEQD